MVGQYVAGPMIGQTWVLSSMAHTWPMGTHNTPNTIHTHRGQLLCQVCNAEHVLATLKEHYAMMMDWNASLLCNIQLQ